MSKQIKTAGKKENEGLGYALQCIALQSVKCLHPKELKAMWQNTTEKRLYIASLAVNPIGLYFLTHNKYFFMRINIKIYAFICVFGYFIEKGTVRAFKENREKVGSGKIKESDNYRKIPKTDVIARLIAIFNDMNIKPAYLKSIENDVETRYDFKLSCDIKKLVKQAENIEHKLELEKNKLTITNNKGITTLAIKKNVVKTYYLDDVISNHIERPKNYVLPFIAGVNYSTGSVMIEDLTKTKHLLIGGKTGSGKSTTFEEIIETLMYWNHNISWYMLDFNESALVKYENFANVKFVECDFPSVLATMEELDKIYKYRRSLFRKHGVINISEYNNKNKQDKLPHIILAVDEANSFKEEFKTQQFDEIDPLMKMILKKGRKYGLWTIQAVQRSQDNDYSMAWKTQMSRIGHAMNDLTDCQNLSPNKEIAEKMLKLDTGEFYLVQNAGGEPIKVKACLRDKKHQELYKILAKGYDKNDFKFTEKKEEIIFEEKSFEFAAK